MDKNILEAIVLNNDVRRVKFKPSWGARLMLTNRDGKELFYGDVHPNVQYEYEAEDPGEYKLCMQLSEGVFKQKGMKVPVQVKFASEFHRSKLESTCLIT